MQNFNRKNCDDSTCIRQICQTFPPSIGKFYAIRYLYKCSFILYTDHKPLQGLLNQSKAIPTLPPARVQGWVLTLATFSVKLYAKGFRDKQCKWFKSLTFANSIITKYSGTYSEHWLLLEHLSSEPLTATQLKTMTRQDKILSRVLYFVQNGWPATVEPTLTPYTSRKYELCLLNGCVLWGTRVVVPTAGCKRILDDLHETHQGASLMKARAWMVVWWPGLDKSVEEMMSN